VAHLLLAGTLATENPNTGLAIIRDTGPAAVYEVGASVGGAYLQSVYRDRVILSRDGRLETLALPKQSVGKGKPAAAAAAVPAAPDVMRGKLNRKAFDSSGLRRDVTAYAPDNSSPPE
jgi:type II secretory pathway component PulC